MKSKLSGRGSALLLSGFLLLAVASCKPKDSDIQTNAQTALNDNSNLRGVNVSVTDGVATLTGEVADETAKSNAESAVSTAKGVKSVTNNITVATPMPEMPVAVNSDDSLSNMVTDAVKDHPGVTAAVNDGVITLTGEIKKSDLPTLMQKLNALKPKQINNQLTIK